MIGLYFATHSERAGRDGRKDGALWFLLPSKLNEESHIHHLDPYSLPIFEDGDEHLHNYLPSVVASEQTTGLIPIAGIAERHSVRMQAQRSVFTVTHRTQTPIEAIGKGNHIGSTDPGRGET